jgi:hypothetical protein
MKVGWISEKEAPVVKIPDVNNFKPVDAQRT